MREANPALTPGLIYDILIHTAHRIPGVPVDRQGYGAVEAGKAVAGALAERHQIHVGYLQSPRFEMDMIHFLLHDHEIKQMQVVGSWDGWQLPGALGEGVEPGVFRAQIRRLPPGEYHYKFLLDGGTALHDPANPYKVHDGVDGFNSILVIEEL
jgi:hypothetical protein